MIFRNFILLFSLSSLIACSNKPVSDLGADDPNLWLEEVEGQKALEWVNQHNDKTLKEITSGKRYKRMERAALNILESTDQIPEVSFRGNYVYNFWRDGKNVRGLWRRTSLKNYLKKRPKWETVLSVDKLAKSEGENWVLKEVDCLPPQQRLCLMTLSRGGKDAAVIREFDTKTKRFVKNGFELPEAKSALNWVDKNTVFVATDFGKGSLTTSGYPRVVKVWKRGTPLASATTVLDGDEDDMYNYGHTFFHPGGQIEVIGQRTTFYTGHDYVYSDGKLNKIPMPESSELEGYFKGYFIYSLRKDQELGGKQISKGSLVAVRTAVAGQSSIGSDQIVKLYTPRKGSSVRYVKITRDRILVNILSNVMGKVLEIKAGKNGFSPAKDMSLLKNTHLSLKIPSALREIENTDAFRNDFFVFSEGFTRPDTLYYYSAKKQKLTRAKSLAPKFSAKGMTVRQIWATSKDGTKVPYFLVGKKSVMKKGNAPTLLYGYGGFEVSKTPQYKSIVGKLWLEKGGLYVVANIRGGGEFGPSWHQAALKTQRHKAYDDFIAVAEDLIAKKITSTPKLAIQGGSNGGLLVGAVMTRRPDLFGAVLCHVPLLDMLRYSQLLAGASWVAEYGDPTKSDMRDYLLSYSPYHKVASDKKYPELFVLTSTKDDRVHPGHARKMVARMEKQGHQKLRYFENTEGGHKGAANLKQQAQMKAMTYEFLYKTIR